MGPELRAALLLNAVRAPAQAFERLRREGLELTWNLDLWADLGLRPAAQRGLDALMRQRDWPGQELERAERAGARFVMLGDPDYPPRLRDLAHPPIGLYVRGRVGALSEGSVAVVGTRRCSPYGRDVALSIGVALARAGLSVISGGAMGIDAAAHRGCLAQGGVTSALLGTGVDRVYPADHRELFAQILERGALASEYPMGTGGEAWRFPERNRLIVALASRTVVVESPTDGGAMHSARLALDIGREVWAVPGRITEDICRGSNRLLHDGAPALVDIRDFIACATGYYGQLTLDLDHPAGGDTGGEDPKAAGLSEEERGLLALLRQRGNRTLDELSAESGMDPGTLSACLLTLVAGGLVSEGAGRYSACC